MNNSIMDVLWGFDDPMHEAAFFVALFFVLAIVSLVLYFMKHKEVNKAIDRIEELESLVESLNAKIEGYKKHEQDMILAIGGLDYKNYKLIPIQITKNIHADENVYQYFVDMDKKAEFILQKARLDIAEELLDKMLKEDLISWHTNYDPMLMRYKVEGRLLIGTPKGENMWMRGNLKEENS